MSEEAEYGCQQNLISPDAELAAILKFICCESHKLTNCGIYYARQLYFKTKKIVGKYDLEKEYKNNLHFQALHSHLKWAGALRDYKNLSAQDLQREVLECWGD